MVNETEPDGYSALHIASANDRPEIASILLDQVIPKSELLDKTEYWIIIFE